MAEDRGRDPEKFFQELEKTDGFSKERVERVRWPAAGWWP